MTILNTPVFFFFIFSVKTKHNKETLNTISRVGFDARMHSVWLGEVSIATFQQLALNALWRSGHLTELRAVGLLEKLKRSQEGRSQEGRSLLGREGVSEKPG